MFKIKPVFAHCDMPCGVYDPSQAKLEAQSVHKILEKYDSLSSEDKMRAIMIKEQRLEQVKLHLWILWTDYFKPEHVQAHPELHELVWTTTKQAGIVKKTLDTAQSQKLLDMIDQVAEIFWSTKKVSTPPTL